jgi:hypothetical protein
MGRKKAMDDVFVIRIKHKLERITNRDVELRVNGEDPPYLEFDLDGLIPQVVLGSNIYEYPGFARMCLEYATTSINEGRHIGEHEFHVPLARN